MSVKNSKHGPLVVAAQILTGTILALSLMLKLELLEGMIVRIIPLVLTTLNLVLTSSAVELCLSKVNRMIKGYLLLLAIIGWIIAK